MKNKAKTDYCIVGRSISGLAVAAALARQNEDTRITLVFSPPSKRRRLVAGCSLRYSTLQRLAKCMGLNAHSIAHRIVEGDQGFYKLTTGLSYNTPSGIFFEKPIQIMNGTSLGHPIGISSRHD